MNLSVGLGKVAIPDSLDDELGPVEVAATHLTEQLSLRTESPL